MSVFDPGEYAELWDDMIRPPVEVLGSLWIQLVPPSYDSVQSVCGFITPISQFMVTMDVK